jgi:hypothetical protein
MQKESLNDLYTDFVKLGNNLSRKHKCDISGAELVSEAYIKFSENNDEFEKILFRKIIIKTAFKYKSSKENDSFRQSKISKNSGKNNSDRHFQCKKCLGIFHESFFIKREKTNGQNTYSFFENRCYQCALKSSIKYREDTKLTFHDSYIKRTIKGRFSELKTDDITQEIIYCVRNYLIERKKIQDEYFNNIKELGIYEHYKTKSNKI